MHIEIRVGGCNAVDGPKDKQDVELIFAGPLIFSRHPIHPKRELMFRSSCCIYKTRQILFFNLFLRLLITPNRFDHAATDHPPPKEL